MRAHSRKTWPLFVAVASVALLGAVVLGRNRARLLDGGAGGWRGLRDEDVDAHQAAHA
jgi:hypothetical protein